MTVKTSLISVAGRAGSGLPALALSAVMSTIVLILVGSIVRVTGNGLGCPDWPFFSDSLKIPACVKACARAYECRCWYRANS